MNTNYSTLYSITKKALKKYPKKSIIFKSQTALSHPKKEIENIKLVKNGDDKFLEIMTNFLGVYNVSSLLPSYLLDKFAQSKDESWRDFFDFFNNYILWILFEIHSLKGYPKSFNYNLSDKISNMFLNILGINNKSIAKAYLPFAPLIISHRKPKIQIEQILMHNFNLKDKLFIKENTAQSLVIPKTQRTYLGFKNSTLKKSFILGKKIVSHQSKITIYIKDIEYSRASKFFPKGDSFKKLKESIVFLTNGEFSVDICLDINYSDSMAFRLDKQSRLGFSTIFKKEHKKSYKMRFILCE